MESPSLGRRALLRLATVSGVVVSGGLVAGCAPAREDDGPDPLAAPAAAARSDAALAAAVAGAHPELAAEAEVVRSTRTEHAQALQQEIDRLDTSEQSGGAPTASRRPPQPQVSSSVNKARQALRAALGDSQRGCAAFVPTAPPYRAGLAGSVSAGCASLLEVLK